MAAVLIIEDDESVALTFDRMLRMAGHTVDRAETAEAGLARVATNRPDAVILDVRMPAMGGLEFIRRLRSDRSTAGLPVGIVTGDYFLKESVLAELATLGAEVRYKPLWMDDFQAFVDGLLADPDATRARTS